MYNSVNDSNGWYKCDQCIEGFFWVESTKLEPGYCKSCYDEMKGCAKCHSENRCSRCDDGLIALADETGCMEPISHCIDNPDNYTQINQMWNCINCEEGFFRNYNTGGCDACAIEGCDACTDDGVCTACSSFYGMMLSFSGDLCRTEFEYCETIQEEYMVSERLSFLTENNLIEDYWCDRCEDSLTWNWNTWECEECGEAVEGCVECN